MSGPRAEVPAGARRTGILGGSFDPPHAGHVSVARDLIGALHLDRLLVIPAGDPPHREVTLPAKVRLDITRRAFAGLPGIEVSSMEIERAGPSYTVDTLEALARRFPSDRLVIAMGADQFASIHRWERWRRLPELARIAVMPRGGRGARTLPGIDADRVCCRQRHTSGYLGEPDPAAPRGGAFGPPPRSGNDPTPCRARLGRTPGAPCNPVSPGC